MTAPTFPYPHRTVEQVVRDGDMHWPLLSMTLGARIPIAAVVREAMRPVASVSHQSNPHHHESLNP